MKTVIFYDWKPGFNKVKFNRLLRETAGYSLSAAINAVEQLLMREPLEISLNSDESAESLVKEAFALGAVGEEVSNASLESATGDVFTTIVLQMPQTVVNNLKHLAPVLGFSGYQPLIQHYLYQGLQDDLERLNHSTVLSVADKLVGEVFAKDKILVGNHC